MNQNEVILTYEEVGKIIPESIVKTVENIGNNIRTGAYPVYELIRTLNGYAKFSRLEIVQRTNYREIRVWLLTNLALVLNGENIYPYYDIFGNIEEIFREYQDLINYLLKIQKYCQNPHLRFHSIEKVIDILNDFLYFDYYFTEVTKSKFDLLKYITEDMDELQTSEETADEIDKVIKDWEDSDLASLYC
jgi:hypothetical protein